MEGTRQGKRAILLEGNITTARGTRPGRPVARCQDNLLQGSEGGSGASTTPCHNAHRLYIMSGGTLSWWNTTRYKNSSSQTMTSSFIITGSLTRVNYWCCIRPSCMHYADIPIFLGGPVLWLQPPLSKRILGVVSEMSEALFKPCLHIRGGSHKGERTPAL